jgi:hypothetical protein
MTIYELIQTWDVETLAEFLTGLMESVEDNILDSVSKHCDATLIRMEHDARRDMNIRLLMQEHDEQDI